MSIINEDALAVMIARVVKEQRPRLEEDITGCLVCARSRKSVDDVRDRRIYAEFLKRQGMIKCTNCLQYTSKGNYCEQCGCRLTADDLRGGTKDGNSCRHRSRARCNC